MTVQASLAPETNGPGEDSPAASIPESEQLRRVGGRSFSDLQKFVALLRRLSIVA